MVDILAYWGRVVTAGVLASTAFWKVAHPEGFSKAYSLFAPRGWSGYAWPARMALVVVELASAVLLTIPSEVGLVGVLSAGLTLALVTWALWRGGGQIPHGCGCWRPPTHEESRSSLLLRNALLLLLLSYSAISGPRLEDLNVLELGVAMLVSVPFVLVILEIPQVAGVVNAFKSIRKSAALDIDLVST